MNISKNIKFEELHDRAISTAKEYRRQEVALISIFQEIEESRVYLHFEMPSLFAYATKLLGLSEATTCMLAAVMRASKKVPELKAAIEEGKITLSSARRIAPVLNNQNKAVWLGKAAKLPIRKLEIELATQFPDRPSPTRIRAKTELLSRIEMDLPHETVEKLKRSEEILAQKRQVPVDMAQTLDAVLTEFLERHDPVQRAERLVRAARSTKTTLVHAKTQKLPVSLPVKITPEHQALARRMGFKVPRVKISAKEIRQFALRDGSMCTFRYTDGNRCTNRKWLHVHHVRQVAGGGSNSAYNLTTLCAAHHAMVHAR